MRFSLRPILVLFLTIIVLHFVANATGLYEMSVVWFDNVLHALGGTAFGFLWLWILQKKNPRTTLVFTVTSTMAFVLGTALLWELFEFLFLKLLTSYAYSLKIYSPSLTEGASDVLSNMIGAFILMVWVSKKLRRN